MLSGQTGNAGETKKGANIGPIFAGQELKIFKKLYSYELSSRGAAGPVRFEAAV